MLTWLPGQILERDYVRYEISLLNGNFIEIDPSARGRVIKDLKALGYRCQRAQKLVLTASGMA